MRFLVLFPLPATTPDATSFLTCGSNVVSVASTVSCTITPQVAGVGVTAPASAFQPNLVGALDSSVSLLDPQGSASLFSFTLSTGSVSGYFQLMDGVSGANISFTIIDVPDATSSFACNATVVFVGTTFLCTLTPQRTNRAILTNASNYLISSNVNSSIAISAVEPAGIASAFTVLVTAKQQSVSLQLSDGQSFSPVTIVIWSTSRQTGVFPGRMRPCVGLSGVFFFLPI